MRGWRKASCCVAIASVAVTAAAGCGSSSDSGSKPGSASTGGSKDKGPVKVLAILDMTGPTKYLGVADKAGLDAGVNYLNANGGIDGRKVQMEVVSDNGDPTTTVTTLVKYIASKGKPDYLFPGSYSSIAAALQPVASRNKILAWGFGDGNNACKTGASATCGPFFAINSQPVVQLTQATEYFKSKGYKKIGVIEDQRDTSVTESAELKQLLPAAGLQSEFVTTPAKTVDVGPQMSKLKASGVDVVFSEQIGPAVGYVLAARKKLGWKVPVVFDISGSSSSITTLSPKDEWSDDVTEQIFSINNPSADYPGRALMLAANPSAKMAGGFGGQPINIAAFGWDAMMLLNATISGTHSLDPVVNQKWLETNPVQDDKTKGLMTAHKFTVDNHENQGWQPTDFAIVPVVPVGEDGVLTSGS